MECKPPFRERRKRSKDRPGAFDLLRALVLALAIAALPGTAHACSLALILAMDSSASVNEDEHRLQLNGLAEALSDPQVVEAIEAVGGIAVTAFEWSGRYQQQQQLGWRSITDGSSARQASGILRQSRRAYNEFPTALGYALGHAAVLMRQAPPACRRKVVDVAGDGINNEGFGPDSAYRAFDFDDITVNALVVGGDPATASYYRDTVLKGPGAFVIEAASYADYAEAMKRKLVREIFGGGYAAVR